MPARACPRARRVFVRARVWVLPCALGWGKTCSASSRSWEMLPNFLSSSVMVSRRSLRVFSSIEIFWSRFSILSSSACNFQRSVP